MIVVAQLSFPAASRARVVELARAESER